MATLTKAISKNLFDSILPTFGNPTKPQANPIAVHSICLMFFVYFFGFFRMKSLIINIPGDTTDTWLNVGRE